MEEVAPEADPLRPILQERLVAIQAFWRSNPTNIKARIQLASAIFLNSQLLITSAHNVYLEQHSQAAADLKVIFPSQPQLRVSSKNQSLLIKLQEGHNLFFPFKPQARNCSHSTAVIRISRLQPLITPLYLLTPPKLHQVSQKHSQNRQVFVCGFPDFKAEEYIQQLLHLNRLDPNQPQLPYPQMQPNQELADIQEERRFLREMQPGDLSALKVIKASLKKIRENEVFYRGKTVVGQSGGAVVMREGRAFFLVAIHGEFCRRRQMGKGALITSQVGQLICKWAQSFGKQLRLQSFYRMQPPAQQFPHVFQDQQLQGNQAVCLLEGIAGLLHRRKRQNLLGQSQDQEAVRQVRGFQQQINSLFDHFYQYSPKNMTGNLLLGLSEFRPSSQHQVVAPQLKIDSSDQKQQPKQVSELQGGNLEAEMKEWDAFYEQQFWLYYQQRHISLNKAEVMIVVYI